LCSFIAYRDKESCRCFVRFSCAASPRLDLGLRVAMLLVVGALVSGR
jgi:hypothetical protein